MAGAERPYGGGEAKNANPPEVPRKKNNRVNLPPAWSSATERGPAAVADLVNKCHVGYRIARYMYASGKHPKMRTGDLLETSKAWSREERNPALAAVNLFNEECGVPLSHLARVLDDQNWDAFTAALRRYRRG